MKPRGTILSFQDAVGALPDRDFIHVMSCGEIPGPVISEGSKAREYITELILRGIPRVADESFQKLGHGLQVKVFGKIYFFETAEHLSMEAAVAYAEASDVIQ